MNLKSIKFSLTKKVALLFVGLTFVLILVMSGSLFVYFKIMVKQSLTNAMELVTINNADDLDKLFSRIELAIDLIQREDSNFVKYLMEGKNDVFEDVKIFQQLENEMKNSLDIALTSVLPYYGTTFFVDENIPLSHIFPNSYEGIASKLSYYNSMPVLCSSQSGKQEEWYKKTIEANGDVCWFGIPENKNVLGMSKLLYTFYKSQNNYDYRKLGVFFIGIDVSGVTKSFDMSKLTYGTVIALSDPKDNIIYSSNFSLEGEKISDIISGDNLEEMDERMKEVSIGEKKSLVYRKHLHGGLSLIIFVPVEDINRMTNGHVVIIVILAAVMMLAGLFLVIYISRIIVRPIIKLSQHMKMNESLKTISCNGVAEDEIGVIYNNYNTLMEQIQLLIHKIYETAEQEKETRLKMLQAQINPHFIYNTLDSICCISLIRKQEDVAEILSKLANLMRYNIKDPDAMVTVKKELEQIYDYIQIQKFRDGNKIDISTNADNEIEKLVIPKMIIQPLVENSIFYGSQHLKTGVLNVSIFFLAQEDTLTIKVCDNGQSADIGRINQHLEGKINISRNSGGLGIRNVKQRIQMKFGPNYHLHYEKAENGNTVAVITIPKIRR